MSGLRGISLRLCLAVGLSFIFWVFVWLSEGGRNTYRNIPVNIESLASDLVIVDSEGFALSESTLPGVDVSVEANAETLANFDRSELQAFVDLSNVSAGNHEVRVRAALQESSSNLNIVDIEPATIELRIERWITTTIPLTVEVQGSPPHAYESGPPDILARRVRSQEPSQVVQSVQVVGPERRVNEVISAFAAVNIEQMIDTSESSLQLEPRDENDNVVEGVSLVPENVFVRVPIFPVVGLRRVPVVGDVTGRPAPGYVVTGIESEPAVINLSGSSRQLNNVNQVSTRPVNINGASKMVTDTVDLIIPQGTQSQLGVTQAMITVQIKPQTMTFTSTLYFTVEITGVARGLRAVYDPLILPISLTGLPQALEQASSRRMVATVDVSGFEPGDYRLQPALSFSEGLSLTGELPDVQVSLRLPDTPTPQPTPILSPTPTRRVPVGSPLPTTTPDQTATLPIPEEQAPQEDTTPTPDLLPEFPDDTAKPTLLPAEPPTPTTPPATATPTVLPPATPTLDAPPPMPFATVVPTTTNPLDLVDSPDDVLSSFSGSRSKPPVKSSTTKSRGNT